MRLPPALRTLCLAVLAVLAAAAPAHAQTASIRGFVRDAGNGQALEGATVIVIDRDGRVSGSTTDPDGLYAVLRLAPGRYGVRVSYIGYELLRDTLALRAGEDLTRVFELRSSDVEGQEVTVSAEGQTASSLGAAGLDVVRPADIERLPTPGVSADLVSYVSTQPGVVVQGDRGGQLFVRGGTPSQNLVLVDGIPLLQPFHLIGFYSAFPADILASADFYAGGFGARYGGRISSVLDVKTRTGNKRRFQGSVSAGPFLATAHVEGPLSKTGSASFLISDRESIIEPVAPTLFNRDLPYRFYDRFGKLAVDLGTRTTATVTAMQTYDRGNLSDLQSGRPTGVNEPEEHVVWRNGAYGVRMLHLPAGVPLVAEVNLTLTQHENLFGTPGDEERRSTVQSMNGGAALTYLIGSEELEFGFGVRNVRLDYTLGGQYENVQSDVEYLTEGTIYADMALPLGQTFGLKPGVRLSAFRGRSTVEPRLRAFFRPGGADARHQFVGAWGLYRQDLEGISDRRDAGDVFTAWISSGIGDRVPRAMHVIGGYGYKASRAFSFEIEGYYKKLDYLLAPAFQSVPSFSARLQETDGTVVGVDVKTSVERGPAFASLAYGFSRTRYRALDTRAQVLYGGGPYTYAPPHDRPHQLTAVVAVDIKGFQLSTQWQFGAGLPFTRSSGFDTFVLLDSLNDVTVDPGVARVLYGQPYDARLPTYHRLDVSLERVFAVRPNLDVTLQAGVTNAYDRRNLFYLDLFTLRRIDQLPLIPSAGLKVAFK